MSLYGKNFYPDYLIDVSILAIEQKAAQNPEWFDGGAVEVRMVPRCASAISAFTQETGKQGKKFRQHCPILKDRNTYVVDNGESLDCVRIVGQKIAACAAADEIGKPMISGAYPLDQEKYPQPDFAPWKGGLGYKVYYGDQLHWHIYVAVSGSTQENDQTCAKVAFDVIRDFFKGIDEKFRVVDPLS